MPVELPPFDPKNNCVKCGNSIPDPVAPQKAGPDGAMMVTGPAPAPTPPNVEYCADPTCLLYEDDDPPDDEDEATEHMHATCAVCKYEWLTQTADAGGT